MSDPSLRPIVVKRIKKAEHGSHGGAWKIAYADFVTAMMAFFLLMWLLGSTTKGNLKGISEFFQTPLKIALMGGEGSGDATSVIKGGGDDLTKSVGQDNRVDSSNANPLKAGGEVAPESAEMDLKSAEAAIERREQSMLDNLKHKLEQAIDLNPALRKHKSQILLDVTTEGLRVQIVDEQNRPMFASGSARMQSYTSVILREIGKVLNEVPNKVSLSGHTDAQRYVGGERGYSNWELSADRANTSRRELIAGGMAEDKILRVVGLSSAVPFDRDDPLSPMNRRISIIVMKRKVEQAIRNEAAHGVEVKQAGTITPGDLAKPIPPPIRLPGAP
jgi:chemotaxis protein MotB